jgi:hypothetical protein
LAAVESPEAFGRLVQDVNFPRFVADLIAGVFDAIVNASVRQMDAYADLVASVAASIEQFRDSLVDDARLRDRLCEIFPELCAPSERLDRRRTHLATIVARGINRIVVSDG